MKQKFYFALSLFAAAVFVCGCTSISVEMKPDSAAIKNYAGTQYCPFYFDVTMRDSLKKKFDYDMYGASTPGHFLVTGDFILGPDASGRVYCVSLKTGKKAGVAKFKGFINSLPIVENSTLFVPVIKSSGAKTKVSLYNYFDGSEINSIEIEGRVLAPPARKNKNFVVITEEGKIYELSDKGEIVMESAVEQFVHSNVLVDKEALYIGTDKGEFLQLTASGSIAKSIRLTDCPLNINFMRDSLLFAFDDKGVFYSFNKISGRVNWKYESGSRMNGAIAADSQYLYLGLADGFVHCLSISDGSMLWKTNTEGMISAAVMVSKNYLVVPNHNYKVSILEKATGRVLKEIKTDGRARITPVIYKNYFIIGYDMGIMQIYEMN